MSSDTCLVLRQDGQFLGLTAQWHEKREQALEFPNARMASRAVAVATRIDATTTAEIVSAEDFDARRRHRAPAAEVA